MVLRLSNLNIRGKIGIALAIIAQVIIRADTTAYKTDSTQKTVDSG